MNLTEDLKAILTAIMDQINTLKSLPTQKDYPKHPDPTVVFLDNRKAAPLDSGKSSKIGGMWTMKYELSSLKFYELLNNTELKTDTALNPKDFYNHIKMCLNAVNILREDLIPGYQSIKIHPEFS